jgi:hypothetical protein
VKCFSAACLRYLATAVSLPPQFLLCAHTSKYYVVCSIWSKFGENVATESSRKATVCLMSKRNIILTATVFFLI